MKETVLLFEIQDKKMKTAITTALLPLKVKVKQVAPADYNKKLGVIAGTLPDTGEQESLAAESLSDSMMILCGIYGARLERILNSLRSRNVRLPYKAILTESNQEWTPVECLEELKKEHAALIAGASAHERIE